jgi:hypothetical protein
MANMAACAAMFHRHDIRAAEKTVVRTYSEEQILESLRMDRSERPFFTPGFARTTPLEHATRWAPAGAAQPSPFPPAASPPVRSDTGELAWMGYDNQRGLVTIDTPRTQALVGFVADHDVSLQNFSAEIENRFCAVYCTSLDGKPLAASSRLLLVAAARATNRAFRWNDDRQTIADWGQRPVVIEPVVGTVSLNGLESPQAVRVTPLTAAGSPLAKEVTVRLDQQSCSIRLGEPPATWYLVEIHR